MYRYFTEKHKDFFWNFYPVIFVYFLLIYYLSFIRFIEEKYILCFITIIFVDLSFVTISTFFCYLKNPFLIIFIPCFIAKVFTIIPFHYFWLKNPQILLFISICALVIDIYIIIITHLVYKEYNFFGYYFYYDKKNSEVLALTHYNYVLPSIVTIIVLLLIILLILIYTGIAKLISLACGERQ